MVSSIHFKLDSGSLETDPSHRGGLGTDWKNTSWEEDGVVIEEWNIVSPSPLPDQEAVHPRLEGIVTKFP